MSLPGWGAVGRGGAVGYAGYLTISKVTIAEGEIVRDTGSEVAVSRQ